MARVAEPNPWAFCPHELAAMEPDYLCAGGCGAEVAHEGDHCSALCLELDLADTHDDIATTTQLDQRIA